MTWRWGQVAHEELSLVYGRVLPPPEVADASRIPGFLVAFGPQGPIGVSDRFRIEERDDPNTGDPRAIEIRAQGSDLDLAMEFAVESAVRTRLDSSRFGSGNGTSDFLQLRGTYAVRGRAGGRSVEFRAVGSAETFR